MTNRALCARCYSPVVINELSVAELTKQGIEDYYIEGEYWAYCPAHDEDLYKFECIVEVKA